MKSWPITSLLVVSLAAAANTTAATPDYPTRPVRVLVGLAPGGGSDTVARIMATRLSETLAHTFVVDNRPSAGGMIASEIVAKAAPDGHTLLLMTPTHVVTPSLRTNPSYDPIRDFAPLILATYTPYALSVRQSVAAKSVKELIALSKTQNLTYASSVRRRCQSFDRGVVSAHGQCENDARAVQERRTGQCRPDRR
jgi:tripartite-type tricarboxylate transporter receptor subunit TctC